MSGKIEFNGDYVIKISAKITESFNALELLLGEQQRATSELWRIFRSDSGISRIQEELQMINSISRDHAEVLKNEMEKTLNYLNRQIGSYEKTSNVLRDELDTIVKRMGEYASDNYPKNRLEDTL